MLVNGMIGAADLLLLSQASPRDVSWDNHKDKSLEVMGIYQDAGCTRYAQRIFACSQSLEFCVLSDDKGATHLKLHSARFCRVRWCPVCQWRRMLMWRARFIKALPEIFEDHPKARCIFLTLTVRNCDLKDLRSTLAGMNEAWKKLIKRTNFPAIGWLKSVEVTRGQDGSAHPHFHILLMVNPSYFTHGYISHAKWVEMWRECLKVDYNPMVNVKTVKNRRKKITVESIKNVDIDVNTTVNDDKFSDIISGVLEVIKYSVKPSDLTGDWLIELTRQLHKTRSISLGGIIKEYLSEDEPEDLINADLEDNTDLDDEDYNLIFEWVNIIRKYAYKECKRVVNK
jgi:plasmid rolling circle replication initiator protein Rep